MLHPDFVCKLRAFSVACACEETGKLPKGSKASCLWFFSEASEKPQGSENLVVLDIYRH